MNKKTITILAGIFLILLIGATFPIWKKYLPLKEKTSVVSGVFNFTSISESNTEKFTIQKRTDQKVFIKKGSDWFLNDKKVIFENVRLFFEEFQKAETKERVAKNPENHKELGVTKETGYVVIFTENGGKILSYIVGNSTAGETTYYVRESDSNDVYAMSSIAFYKLSDSVNQWIEKAKDEVKKEEKKTLPEKKK